MGNDTLRGTPFLHRGSSFWINVEQTSPFFLLRTGALGRKCPGWLPATFVRKIASLVSKACYLWDSWSQRRHMFASGPVLLGFWARVPLLAVGLWGEIFSLSNFLSSLYTWGRNSPYVGAEGTPFSVSKAFSIDHPTWYLILDTWYLILDTWYLILDLRHPQ